MDNLLWLMLAALALGAALAAAWWLRQKALRPAPFEASDRFAPAAALTEIEADLLNYLVRAFPGRPVLFRSPLSKIVAVRRAQHRMGAQQRLAAHTVDYVVCDREGKPVYAFELDALHHSAPDAPSQGQEQSQERLRVLQAAGVPVIRLSRSVRDMPPPDAFRRRLRAIARAERGSASARGGSRSGRAQLETAARHGAAPPRPIHVTDLMELEPADDTEMGAMAPDSARA
jgi:hypothetical protein